MAYQDSDVRGGKVTIKNSPTAGEAMPADGLVPGELALNSADGAMYYRTAAGGVGAFPSAAGFLRIVSLTQAAYDALTPDANTLYVITPNP